MKFVAFFNNKGGVGKTSLVYHLGWAYSDMGLRVLMADLDPQSNLTSMCLDEERVEALWSTEGSHRQTIRGAVQPIVDGLGDIRQGHCEELSTTLALLPGDIRLANFEAKLSDAWPRCLDRDPAAFRTSSSLYRVTLSAAEAWEADLVLIDVGPNLGAINRAALIGADFVVTPLGADLFSIQGLRNLGPTLDVWRQEWGDRRARNPVTDLDLPPGTMRPVGYIVMQPNLYGGRVTQAYDRWLQQVPEVYTEAALGKAPTPGLHIDNDPQRLAILKHYRSLMPMAQTARKPIFHLTAADGALGAHSDSVRAVGADFRELAREISKRIDEQR